MDDRPSISASAAGASPAPKEGFESDSIREVQALVAALASGVARLRVSRISGHPEWPQPEFEVLPVNPRAARFGGYAVETDLYLTIGEADREFVGFASGGNIVSGAKWQDELRWIWQAVIAGGFTQRHYLDARGEVIAWYMKLPVAGKDLLFRNGRRERVFGRAYTRLEDVTYEAYY